LAATRKEHKTEQEKWIDNLVTKKGFDKASVAMANKNARRMWAVMAS